MVPMYGVLVAERPVLWALVKDLEVGVHFDPCSELVGLRFFPCGGAWWVVMVS